MLVEVEVPPDLIIVVWHERLDDSRWRICSIIPFWQKQVIVQLYILATGSILVKRSAQKSKEWYGLFIFLFLFYWTIAVRCQIPVCGVLFSVDPSQNRYLPSHMSQKTHVLLNKPRCRNIVEFVLWRETLACVFAIYVTDASILPSLSFLLFQQSGFEKKCRNEKQKLRRTNWMSYVTYTGTGTGTWYW